MLKILQDNNKWEAREHKLRQEIDAIILPKLNKKDEKCE